MSGFVYGLARRVPSRPVRRIPVPVGVAVCALVALVAQSSALADPVGAPDWWNNPNSTTTKFSYDFLRGSGTQAPWPPVPDAGALNPFDPPAWQHETRWEANAEWDEGFPGRLGLYSQNDPNRGAGKLWVKYDNEKVETNVKEVFFQFVFHLGSAGGYTIRFKTSDPQNTTVVTSREPAVRLPDGFYRRTVGWRVTPQPDWEQLEIRLVGTAVMDKFYYGTNCTPIPEPASLSLLALGGLAALRRRG